MKTSSASHPGWLLCFFAIAIMFGGFLTFSPARAELLFADSFDYPEGNLGGQGPPPGSPPGQGGWVASNNEPRVAPHGLSYGGILSAGNCARLHSIFGAISDEAVAAIGPVTPDYGTVWIGFLMRKPKGDVREGFAVVVAIGESITDPSVGIGMLFDRNRYGLDNDTGLPGSKSVSDVSVSGQTAWLVTKLDFIAGHEYLWIDPSPESEPDIADAAADLKMTPEFQAVGFPFLRLRVGYARAVFQFDELRVGTAFTDVVNPE
jgi:hypothetical protein